MSKISIHALREEGDEGIYSLYKVEEVISIHALREEGDEQGHGRSNARPDFYPRPPRGGRLSFLRRYLHKGRKISIHALREEGDTNAETLRKDLLISIHALREEGDHGEEPRRA